MMKAVKTKKSSFIHAAILLTFGFVFLTSACERGGDPIIENQRNENIRIFVILVSGKNVYHPGEETEYGDVPAHATTKLSSITFVYPDWINRIEARNASGNVVFSHDYKMSDLEKIRWKITIPP